MILKLFKIFYSSIIEPILITILLWTALVKLLIKKLKKTFKIYKDSPNPLITCRLLSIINRIILQFFVKEFGFGLLFIALVTAVITTLLKITIRMWEGKDCSIDRIFNIFVLSCGFSLIFTLIFAIIRLHWL